MNSFKKLFATIGSISVFCSLVFTSSLATDEPKAAVIAITQIAPHPSLDAIRQGVVDTIRTKIPDVKIIFENAQGNMAMAVQIAGRLVSQEPDVMVTITTPSTQAALKTAREQEIPLVFAAVSDPTAIKLPAPGQNGNDVTGVADIPPVEEQVELIKKLTPTVKNIGFVYNPSEANSVAVLEQLSALLEKSGMTIYPVTANTTTEVATAAQSLAGKVDAVFVSNDNTIVSALDSILKVTNNLKIPVYSSDPESVQRGCLAATAPSQYDIGCQAGQLVLRVLAGESVSDLPVESAKNGAVTVNESTARALGVKIPSDLLYTTSKGA